MMAEGGEAMASPLLLIAASPSDMLAGALAQEFQRLGWQVVITDQVGQYAPMAQACIVPMSPMALQSPAVNSALEAHPANMIPLVTAPMTPPPGPWIAEPFIFTGSAAQTCESINHLLVAPPRPASPEFYGFPRIPASIDYPTYPSPYPPAYPPVATNYPTTPFAYPPVAPGVGAPYGAKSAGKKARGRALVFVAIGGVALFICLIAIAGYFTVRLAQSGELPVVFGPQATATAIATATPAPTATPSPPPTPTLAPGFTRFTDPAGNFQINQPANWSETTSGGDDYNFGSPDHLAYFVIAESPGEASASEVAAQESDFIKSLASTVGGTAANVQGPSAVTVNGLEWQQVSGDVTYKGVVLHSEVFAIDHAGTFYFMGCVTSKGQFATTDAQVYQPVLHSFYFTFQ